MNGETILGALCIYVLIGMMFATLDYGIELASGTYFAQPGPHGPPDFVYFSYITMATVGYGDLTPAPGLPRTSSVLEALMGQIFLVVLVARLVAMYSPTFMRRGEILRQKEEDQATRTGAPLTTRSTRPSLLAASRSIESLPLGIDQPGLGDVGIRPHDFEHLALHDIDEDALGLSRELAVVVDPAAGEDLAAVATGVARHQLSGARRGVGRL